ncbi:MAG: nucleoside monophosphate kinase [Parcubacteria group bacterium]
MSTKVFLFMGRPGAGKGVQSELLSKVLGYPIFSTGVRVREFAAEPTLLGKKIKEVSEEGGLVPFWFASYLFEEALFRLKDEEGIIFEGVGRKEPEARLFTEVNDWMGRDFKVIYLDTLEETVIERLKKRRATSGRTDDEGHKLQNRFDHYNAETVPALYFFRSLGRVIDINGEQTPQEVHAEIMEKLKPFLTQ